MRQFLLHLSLFAMIMVLCDRLVGVCGDSLVARAVGGETARKNYIVHGTRAQALIFGSSRAQHHYDPDIIEDSLGLPTYNCGLEGNGVIGAYGFLRMITDRYYPRIIVYDIFANSDIIMGDDSQYLGDLRHFYDCSGIDSLFWSVDKSERYKMISQLYRFNSTFGQVIIDNLHPVASDTKGYRPLDRAMAYDPKRLPSDRSYECDSLKLQYIELFIKVCQGKSKLIFTASPLYNNTDDTVLAPIRTLCAKYAIPFLSHYADTTFNYHREYFSDGSHLNRTGATAYSKTVASEIKRLLSD